MELDQHDESAGVVVPPRSRLCEALRCTPKQLRCFLCVGTTGFIVVAIQGAISVALRGGDVRGVHVGIFFGLCTFFLAGGVGLVDMLIRQRRPSYELTGSRSERRRFVVNPRPYYHGKRGIKK